MINAFPRYEYVEKGKDPIYPENKETYDKASKAGKPLNEFPRNMYHGEDVGFGGYVYAEPGMYEDVITLDVSGMHPASILALNCLGDYTPRYKQLVDARTAIKHKDFEAARQMFDGKLAKYLEDEGQAKKLSGALKLVQNSFYGMTSSNKINFVCRDPRNVNNIVALRGALFMVDTKLAVQEMGFTVISCKTDSIKIVHPSQEIVDFVIQRGKEYGYNFEVENIFEKICLVNDAVYIAKLADNDPENPGKWKATGAQFAVPYVFKTLFSKEPLEFADYCETKAVEAGNLYLDMNENLPEGEHDYHFVGRVGQFCPMKEQGGILYREKDGKYYAAAGTKGYRWLESEVVKNLGLEDLIDISYYEKLSGKAVKSISEFGDFEWFVG